MCVLCFVLVDDIMMIYDDISFPTDNIPIKVNKYTN